MEFASSSKQTKETESHSDNNRLKLLLPKSQLKSHIPKPVPYVRRARESHSKCCSSIRLNKTAPQLCNIELNLNKGDLPQSTKQTQKGSQTLSSRSYSVPATNSSKSSYLNVRAKIDNKTPVSLLLKSEARHPQATMKKPKRVDANDKRVDANDKNESHCLTDVSEKIGPPIEVPPGDQISKENVPNSEHMLEKKEQFLTAYSDANNHHPQNNQQLTEASGGFLKKNIFDHMEGSNNYLLKECAPDFLSSFEKQMEEVSESWLQLICDLIVTKVTIGKSALSNLSLYNPTLNLRDEINKFFQILPTQGELLHGKLCKIEEEQFQTLRVVIQNILALTKEHDELKQKYCQFEVTSENTNCQLKQELAILGQENKELGKKYLTAIEKYETEKSKTTKNEKHKAEIIREVLNVRHIVKHAEEKCKELENRGKKAETSRLTLEKILRNLEIIHGKDVTKYEELLKKHTETENIVENMKCQLEEKEHSRTLIEEKVKEVEDELTALKATFSEILKKRSELEKEVCSKTEKINELEAELNSLKTNKSEHRERKILKNLPDENNAELEKDLFSSIELKSQHVQELKKKINRLEHMLKEKSSREEKLLAHITKLSKKCHSKSSLLNGQIKELQSTVKHLNNEILELEKILGEKTLELDERDRLIKGLQELIQLKNENLTERRKSDEKRYNEKLLKKSIEVEHYITQNQTDKRFSIRHKKMVEMFSLLERKQMEIMKLERRILGLQKFQEEKGRTEIEQKQSISSMEHSNDELD